MAREIPLENFHVGSPLGRDVVQFPHAGSKHTLRHGTHGTHRHTFYVNGVKCREYMPVYDTDANGKRTDTVVFADYLLYLNTYRIRFAWYRGGFWVLGIKRPYTSVASMMQAIIARGDIAALDNSKLPREHFRVAVVEHATRRVYRKTESEQRATERRARNARADVRTRNDFYTTGPDTYVQRAHESAHVADTASADDTARDVERDVKRRIPFEPQTPEEKRRAKNRETYERAFNPNVRPPAPTSREDQNRARY